MMKIGIEIKKTAELSDKEIKAIIDLKNQYWKHEEKEHILWMEKNIFSNDFHLCMGEEALLGYLNLVHVGITINKEQYKVLGIGNVCVDRENDHIGIGGILMATANAFIKKQNMCGILLCKDSIVQFYLKSNWESVNIKNVFIKGERCIHNIMVYDPLQSLPHKIENMEIERNF